MRLAGAAVFGQASLAQAQPAERAGMVTELKGDAFAEARNQRRTLEQSAALFIEDTVGRGRMHRLRCVWAKTRPCIWDS
jgi:hypothetical protein